MTPVSRNKTPMNTPQDDGPQTSSSHHTRHPPSMNKPVHAPQDSSLHITSGMYQGSHHTASMPPTPVSTTPLPKDASSVVTQGKPPASSKYSVQTELPAS